MMTMKAQTDSPSQRDKRDLVRSFYGQDDARIHAKETSREVVKYAENRLDNACKYLQVDSSRASRISRIWHSQIQLGKIIGEGSFHSIYEVKSFRRRSDRTRIDPATFSCDEVVVKVLRRKMLSNPTYLAAGAADLVKEGCILASLQHDHILPIRGMTPTGLKGFLNGRHDSFFLILDRLEDTLRDRLHRWRRLQSTGCEASSSNESCVGLPTFKQRLLMVTQIADALDYLHSHSIICRDVKPDNIGFDKASGALKLFDLDVSRTLPPKSKTNENMTFRLTQAIGSRRYMSPECCLGEPYNLKSDVYSLGLVCHEVLTLTRPYNDLCGSEELKTRVFDQKERPTIPSSWPFDLASLVESCWSEHIPFRPTMKDVHDRLRRFDSL